MNEITFIIFGASGDLAKRKLLPALYELVRTSYIQNYLIVGVAFNDIAVQDILDATRPFIRFFDELVFKNFADRFFYYRLNFLCKDDFVVVAAQVKELEKKCSLPGNRIHYIASAANFYCPITQYLAESGLAYPKGNASPWQRIIYEKPFGHDAQSAHLINNCIATYFDELHIYRIDHYLTKELVSNIVLVRFTNLILEPLWNNNYIDSVQIILNESVGINDRGLYYDKYGALKDMMQNHMLELLALIGMESPVKVTGENIRSERAKVLASVRPVEVLLGQYEGYRSEKHVDPQSTTDTFAVVSMMIDNKRWRGVPFYLKTGKCLAQKESLIHIAFKHVECLLTQNCPSDSNALVIRIAPNPAFFLILNAKKPGALHEVVPVQMEFAHNQLFGQAEAESYEVIFQEVIRGEHSIAVRFDEIESAWKIIDKVSSQKVPLYSYLPGSNGPEEALLFAQKHGIRWRA